MKQKVTVKFSKNREDLVSKVIFIPSSQAWKLSDGKIRVDSNFISKAKLKVKTS